MRPSQKFLNYFRIIRFGLKCCGADIVDENYKMNIITYMTTFCIIIYFIFTAYTVLSRVSDDWTILLESFCMVGSVLQGISKLISAVYYQKDFCSKHLFLKSIYFKYEIVNDKYEKILDKCIVRLVMILKVTVVFYGVTVMSFLVVPAYMFFFTDRRLFVMHFYIPYQDVSTLRGYLITVGIQTMCLFFGALGNCAGDMCFLSYYGHVNMLVDVFKLKGQELGDLAQDINNPEVKKKLFEVIEWHQMYSRFIARCDDVSFWINFTEITTSALSIVLTLVIIFTGDWPGAYPYLLVSFSMLYLYCGMGTLVELANDRMVDGIYDIDWFLLTVPQQKTIRMMLMKAQSQNLILVGGVAPLSVSTGLQVTKTVYSVFMMLLNFLG